MSRHPASDTLTAFIRETLGCGCPAEVFEDIDEDHTATSSAVGAARRIDVGGRLLIYIAQPSEDGPTPAHIHAWVKAGRSERDEGQMNRWRLVIQSDAIPPNQLAAIAASFREAAGSDDRLHLHLIDSKELPQS